MGSGHATATPSATTTSSSAATSSASTLVSISASALALFNASTPVTVAKVVSEARELTHDWGVQLDRAGVNVDVLRARKEKVIGNLTGGLKQLAKQRGA